MHYCAVVCCAYLKAVYTGHVLRELCFGYFRFLHGLSLQDKVLYSRCGRLWQATKNQCEH